MARSQKTVTIRFFELVLSPSLDRVEGREWGRSLSALGEDLLPPVRHGQGEIDGHVYGPVGAAALSLTVERVMAARQRNLSLNERKSMRTDGAGWQPAEESFAVFFEDNVFGLLRTSNSAPSHTAVANWLSHFSPPRVRQSPGSRWHAKPVVNESVWDELRDSGREINVVDFTLRPDDAPPLPGNVIGSCIREIRGGYHEGVEIKLTIRAGRSRGADHNRSQNYAEIQSILEADGPEHSFVKSAKAMVQPPGGGAQEEIDLLHQRIAKTVDIPVPESDPEGVELGVIAASEIRRAYGEMRGEISNLVQRPG